MLKIQIFFLILLATFSTRSLAEEFANKNYDQSAKNIVKEISTNDIANFNITKEELKYINNKTKQYDIDAKELDREINLEKFDDEISKIFKNIDIRSLKKAQKSSKNHLDQLLIFVSSSIDQQSLKQYALNIRKIDGVLVFRGLIDNSFIKTSKFVQSLTDQGAKAIIDPLLFSTFKVENVPQIILVANDHDCKYQRCYSTPIHDRIAGNITIEYALQLFAKNNGATSKQAQNLLTNLRSL